MNGALVFVTCEVDAIPLGLYTTRDEAIRIAARTTMEDILPILNNVFECFDSLPLCVSVVTFENGYPVGIEMIQDMMK